MSLENISKNGLALLGCGNMGWALLQGWLKAGLPKDQIWVIEPYPSDQLLELAKSGVRLNVELPEALSIFVIAVKPQIMAEVLAKSKFQSELVVSIAAGVAISTFEKQLGKQQAIVRVMPNTPVSVGRGMSVIVGNDATSESQMETTLALMKSVGDAVRLESEDQIDAATGLSGSGPGYVFYMIEALTAAGVAEGLPVDLSRKLAQATVAGAGVMATLTSTDASVLRQNVTSPRGTTEAGLNVLMQDKTGLMPLMKKTVQAAAKRSRELRA